MSGRRIAFFGGSFDPPHCGHLAVARAAQQALALDQILFVPVGTQPFKPQGSSASYQDRVAMTELAIAADPAFTVSLLDSPQPTGQPNYSIDSLTRLRNQLDPSDCLYCLMGSDAFSGLRGWYRAAELPFIATLVVASRPGQPLDELFSALPAELTLHTDRSREQIDSVELQRFTLKSASGQTAALYLLPGLSVDVSATAIRERLQFDSADIPQEELSLPASVSQYIRAHHLYQ